MVDKSDKPKIEHFPTYKITPFCHEFVCKVADVKGAYLTNESSLHEMPSPHFHRWWRKVSELPLSEEEKSILRKEEREYWFSKIEEHYNLNLRHLESLNIAEICGELERMLDPN